MPSLAIVWRARHGVVCAVLTLLAFLQSPGLIVADTKIDLALNPAGFLGRALHLWDPAGAFGQLQNQAYGYLWPMGPFFLVGTGIGLPAWVVQRLWWALLLCVAYTGAVRLASLLGIGTPVSRLMAGLVFALSPRILTELGALSIEAWPSAVAPWVLIPLVAYSRGLPIVDLGLRNVLRDQLTFLTPRSTGVGARRAVAASAVAVACAGGVNATAVFAVVPLAVLWLLMLRRVGLLVAWCCAVLAATVWWLVPLLVLGRYSPPFLDYIESAATTTGVTDPVTVLRGASHWLGWLNDQYEATLPAGWEIATNPVLVVATVLLAAAGLLGLSRPGMPHRRFLVAGLLLGFLLVGLGHVGELPGTFASAQREFLDGAGAPLRNVHKFDVLMRLPLALGLAHLLGLAGRAARWSSAHHGRGPSRARRTALLSTVGTAAALAVMATPALAGGLAAPHGFAAVPGYWRDAAAFLNARADDGRVLVIPGARFPNYTWGDTLDEITQPLLTRPAAVRHAIPLSPPATIRMMDAVESTLASGYGSAGLADYLARSGVAYVLVRSDLNYGRAGTTAPLLVQQALDRTPGLAEVARFGPQVSLSDEDGVPVRGLGVAVPALQVLRVERPVSAVVAWPATEVPTVVGGPESLLWLAEAGRLGAAPTVLAGDVAVADRTAWADRTDAEVVITDGMRLRDVSFGTGRDAASATLPASAADGTHDYRPDWNPAWLTTTAYEGIADVRAASSWAQASSVGGARPEHQPFAAVDGDPSTSWRPSPGLRAEGQWLEIVLDRARPVPEVTIHFGKSAGRPSRITVDTGLDRTSQDVTGSTVVIGLRGSHPVRTIRLTIDEFEALSFDDGYGVAEIEIPGVSARRTLVVPAPPAIGGAATVVLTGAPTTPACFVGVAPDTALRCDSGVARASEDGTTLDRMLTLPAPSAYDAPEVWARPRPGAPLDALLDDMVRGANGPTVVASSAAFDEPLARPGAVLDGDPGTTWWAAPDDPDPQLRITWPAQRLVSGLRLALGDAAGTPVSAVTVISDGVSITRRLTDGVLALENPLWTDELILRLHAGATAHSYDPYRDEVDRLPVAVTEVAFDAAVTPIDRDTALELACGSGPTLRLGSDVVPTRLSASLGDLLARHEVPALPCEPAGWDAAAGPVRVAADPSELAVATRIVLDPVRAAVERSGVTVHIDQWSATQRRVTVPMHEDDLVFAMRENTNPGWTATIGGTTLESVIVDGWQQGWLVPAGVSGQVVLRFAPDGPYRVGLAAGAAALLAIVGLAVVPRRRPGPPIGAATPAPGSGKMLAAGVGGAALIVAGGILGGVVVVVTLAVLALRLADAYDRRSGGPPGQDDGRPGSTRRRGLRAVAHWLPAALLSIGGLAWLNVSGAHRDLLPQLAGFLAVAALWSANVLTGRTGSPPAVRGSGPRP